MKKETYFRNRDELEYSFDESEDYSGPDLNAPKHSPMRRKEKFRIKDFKTGKIHKNRKRNLYNKVRYNFEF